MHALCVHTTKTLRRSCLNDHRRDKHIFCTRSSADLTVSLPRNAFVQVTVPILWQSHPSFFFFFCCVIFHLFPTVRKDFCWLRTTWKRHKKQSRMWTEAKEKRKSEFVIWPALIPSRQTLTPPLGYEIRNKNALGRLNCVGVKHLCSSRNDWCKNFPRLRQNSSWTLSQHILKLWEKHFQVLFRDTDRMDDARYFHDQRHGYEH